MTPDVARRLAVIQREWQRVDPKFLDDDEQRFWATIAGRQIRFDQRAEFARKFTEGRAGKGALETFLAVCAAENPNRRLRMTALADRVATPVERADFDDLVTLVSQAPPWEKDRSAGVRILLRAIGEGKANAPDQILARWTWRLARATRKVQDRRASAEFPEAKRLLGAVANSRGHRHEDNVAKLVQVARALPLAVGAALLASADGYTPRANALLDQAREELGAIQEIANALAENLPAPKAPARKSRRRRKKRRPGAGARRQTAAATGRGLSENGEAPGPGRRSRRPPSDAAPTVTKRRPSRDATDEAGQPAAGPLLPVAGGLVAVLAVAQEARQLGRERLARRQVGLVLDHLVDRVGPPLELLDVRGRLGIRGDRLADLLGVDLLRLLELAELDRDAEQLAEPVAERARRARARRERDVVRHRRPEADRRDPRLRGRRRGGRRRCRSAPRSARAAARAPRRATGRWPRR